MKTSEMRLGNLVQYGGATAKVCQIEKSFFYCESDGSDFFTRDEEPGAKPIPLTEKWLLKFGFEKKQIELSHLSPLNLPVTFNLHNSPFSYSQGKLILKTGTGDFCVNIEYVHQLQNLYFALLGEELTIKSE